MKEKILNASLDKIFKLTTLDLVNPSNLVLDNLSKEELKSFYEKAWFLLYDVNEIAFEASQASNLLNKLEL